MDIALSELQQKTLWEEWLGAEIRANYFAELCRHYQQIQRVITCATLVASSGAAVTWFATLPPQWNWLRPTLLLVTAGLSLWGFVVNYNKHVTDRSDLHFRWNTLSHAYEALWGDMYSSRAPERLAELRQRGAELSKTGAPYPNKKSRMIKWTRYVIDRHAQAATA